MYVSDHLNDLIFAYLSEQSLLYDNNMYHEECLRCNACAINLTGVNQKRARRFKNQILCDLHFAGLLFFNFPIFHALIFNPWN